MTLEMFDELEFYRTLLAKYVLYIEGVDTKQFSDKELEVLNTILDENKEKNGN